MNSPGEETKTAAAVDPADAKAVVAAAAREGVRISHVLTTHCHWDHAGGNKDMVSDGAVRDLSGHGLSQIWVPRKQVSLCPGIEVVGGKGDNAAAVSREVGDCDIVEVGKLRVGRLCHTYICLWLLLFP